jgi:hypothetical protein
LLNELGSAGGEYGETTHKGPYYPDVAQIAREMVRKSIGALDPINLPSQSRDKVREEFSGKEYVLPAVTLILEPHSDMHAPISGLAQLHV